jgi:NADH-quinone oxidoreductase subunit J
MNIIFFLSSFVAILSTGLAITRRDAVHALLYLIVSLLAVAVIFLLLGAPFVAALEVIIYAGAIMVLFIFVVMMLDKGWRTEQKQTLASSMRGWIGPAFLSAILLGEFLYLFAGSVPQGTPGGEVGPKEVGIRLLSTYVIGVELASMLLLPGLIGAYHLGRRVNEEIEE